MSRIFVTADLHFGHQKLADIRGVSDQDVMDRWNAVVGKRDVVYVLGDVFRLERLAEMNGCKKLALGNHDTYQVGRYLDYFSKVHGSFCVRGCLLTHIPVHEGQKYRYGHNIHGHLHTNVIDDPWYINVSLEQTNYTPVLLDKVLNNG